MARKPPPSRQPEELRGARPLDHPADWSLDIGGVPIEVPKDPLANAEFRRELILSAEDDPEQQSACRAMCSQKSLASMLFWINTFAYTYILQEYDENGHERSITSGSNHVPFITYPYQDDILSDLFEGITQGHDIAVDKTRKMGLSWLILTAMHWFWQFVPGTHFAEFSRKEDLVDSPGDPDSLFWKHDYLIANQPAWMLPVFRRTDLKLVNKSMDCTIIGQSTTSDGGHGGRKTAVLFDEIARMRHAKLAWEGASQMTACRIANSTAHGPGFFASIVTSGKCKVLTAPFYDHPVFGRGRYVKREEGKDIVSSPWRDLAVSRAVSKREIAENIDRDHMGAGYVFFDADQIERHRAVNACAPDYIGHIRFVGEGDRDLNLRRKRTGFVFDPDAVERPWSLWLDLEEDEEGEWRPPQTKTYIFGIDVAYGLQAAESTIIVKELETGRQVGEFASSVVEPGEFGRQIMEAGHWFGGAHGCAFVCWEANGGGGQIVSNALRTFSYPWLYSMIDERRRDKKRQPLMGWHSNDERKPAMLGLWRGALARDEFIPRSRRLLDQARQYIFMENGSVGPAHLEQESGAADKTHGDLVIGAGLAQYGSMYCFRCKPPIRKAPPFTFAWRGERKKANNTKDSVKVRETSGGLLALGLLPRK